MRFFKDAAKRVFNIPFWIIIPLVLFSTLSLIYVFSQNLNTTFFAYISYFVSAYTLTVITVYFVKVFPLHYKRLKQKFVEHPYGNKYINDISYKVKVSLYISLAVNILYSTFKLISSFIYSSFWWGAIAIYYIILSIIRFLLIRYMKSENNNLSDAWKKYKFCGYLMILINLSLSGIVFQMVWQNKSYSYPEIIVIASAAYTFYSVTVSVIEIIRYRKYNNPIISASKAIRFAAALVSLLNLETAMLSAFGEAGSPINQTLVALTGCAVCCAVLGISMYMIIKSNRNLKN